MGNAGGFSKNFGVPPCHALHGPVGLTLLRKQKLLPGVLEYSFSYPCGVPPCHALHGPMGLTLLQGKNYCLESWNTVFLAVAVCRRVAPYTALWALLS